MRIKIWMMVLAGYYLESSKANGEAFFFFLKKISFISFILEINLNQEKESSPLRDSLGVGP